jgi:YggT family protein
MAAIVYLVETLLSLALFACLLRLLLQWVRADFRNPLARALVQITNPVLVPLRRLLPAIGRFDTATGVAVVLRWQKPPLPCCASWRRRRCRPARWRHSNCRARSCDFFFSIFLHARRRDRAGHLFAGAPCSPRWPSRLRLSGASSAAGG